MRVSGLLAFGCAAAMLVSPLAAQTPDAAGIEFFEKDIRPILVARCYKCHSAGASPVEGGLLLDSRPGWEKGGDSGPVLAPGNAAASRLATAIQYQDADLKMPPDGKLPEREVAALIEWINRGAPDPRTGPQAPNVRKLDLEKEGRHWAYQPLVAHEPPAVTDASWPRTPIDRFILAKQEANALAPNPPLDPQKLIRRVYFDLIGLPPTPEETQAFIAEASTEKYEQLVDRLLASPHFGERWGRHWLDVARFAESHGYEQDYDRPTAYHYRDFVIKAFNQDLPYNTFVQWQIAGDELEPENPLALMATGFLGAGVHATQITANQAEKERYDELDDITRTIGSTMLGLSIGCARCHDHKFDPIPTLDYYRLLSTFSTTVRSDMDVNLDPATYRQAKEAYELAHAPLAEELASFERDELPGRFRAWLPTRASEPPEPAWVLLDPVESKSAGGATFAKQPDGSLLVSGPNPDHETFTFVAHTDVRSITAIRLEALAHESLVKGGPGRATNGNFGLSDLSLTVAPRDGSQPPAPVKLVNAKASFDQDGLPVTRAIDEDPNSCWAVDPQFGKDHAAVFETETDVGFEGGSVLTLTLSFQCNTQHAIGRPRLSLSGAPRPVGLQGATQPPLVVAALAALAADAQAALPADQQAAVLAWFAPRDDRWKQLNQAVAEHAKQAPQPNLTKVLVCSEGVPAIRLNTQGLDFYDPTYVLARGDLSKKQDVATQSFLQVLMHSPERELHWQVSPPEGSPTSYRRRSLANWLTDADRGAGRLLARVIVNRLWQHHLGQGIVGTPSDFGTQGDRPTHPELLDWLATELIRGGWKLKPIHKLIVTSAVYQQGDQYDPAKAAKDMDNKLLWRRTPQRLEAEIVRDAILSVSGALDPTQFGPGTLDLAQRRRSIYFFIKRSQLIPMMMLFDAPDTLQDIARRPTTTIAPQALLLLNNTVVRDYARQFAQRIDPGPDAGWDGAVRQGYWLALGRAPADDELADSSSFLTQQFASYQSAGKTDARALALADFCQVIVGLNEFIYVP